MTIQIAVQGYDFFECRLLDHRLRPLPAISLDEASTDAAARSARAILQHAQASQQELVGFELRCNGLRVLTSLESSKTPAISAALVAGEGPRGYSPLF
jgi:hypothetical protein